VIFKVSIICYYHFNTRYIETTKSWFGGGSDLTPMYEDISESAKFHQAFKDACDKFEPIIQEGKIFLLSNGTVKIANQKFTSIKNDFCLVFDK
jgi:hypothetical protein